MVDMAAGAASIATLENDPEQDPATAEATATDTVKSKSDLPNNNSALNPNTPIDTSNPAVGTTDTKTHTARTTAVQTDPLSADNVNSVTTDSVPLGGSGDIPPEEKAGTVTPPSALVATSAAPLGAGAPPASAPMASSASAVPLSELSVPILLELDPETWEQSLDKLEAWLGDLTTVQAAYRQLAGDTAKKLHEAHLQTYIADIYSAAQVHEAAIPKLYEIIGRSPSAGRKAAGSLLGKASEASANLLLGSGGAVGGWRDLHQLFMYSLHAISAWSAAETLGFAIGIREIIDITFPIVQEKFVQHRMLQELTLETVVLSVLYKSEI